MANHESVGSLRNVERRRQYRIGPDEEAHEVRGDKVNKQGPRLGELRKILADLRIDELTRQRGRSSSKMGTASISRSVLSSSKLSRHRRKRTHSHHSEGDAKQRRKRKPSTRIPDSGQEYVYGSSESRVRSSTSKTSASKSSASKTSTSRHSRQNGPGRDTMSIISEEEDREDRKVNIIYIRSEGHRSSKHNSLKVADENEKVSRVSARSIHQSSTTSSRRSATIPTLGSPRRSRSVRDLRESRPPPIKRSNTVSNSQGSTKPVDEASVAGSRTTNKRSSFLGMFAPPSKDVEPIKLVECLTCLSDDIPSHKAAKLKCGHRMCHSCLRRIFKLSVNDPQHMPPKCCTSDHIPLKHVDRLFDVPFKKLWNRKYQEFTTKNRIYCPSRRCGEWIKPENFHTEAGRKYGKCSKCKTKACCLCNGKWHGNRDCPKDEETNQLLEAAKEAGWQRCYSCRTMVELKEGCNHMTCRCKAEFCMLCGLKWKTCDCPWFSFEQIEDDRHDHMHFPEWPPLFERALRPRHYMEEIEMRRRQDINEELARRIQTLDVDDDDYNGGIGDMVGVGNGQDHFLNQDYRRPGLRIPVPRPENYILGINRLRGIPPPPPPELEPEPELEIPRRRHRDRDRAERHDDVVVIAEPEQIVQRIRRSGYINNTARHTPNSPLERPRRSYSLRQGSEPAQAPSPSVLAGLRSPRGNGRVNAWMAHVEPGVAPAEDVPPM